MQAGRERADGPATESPAAEHGPVGGRRASAAGSQPAQADLPDPTVGQLQNPPVVLVVVVRVERRSEQVDDAGDGAVAEFAEGLGPAAHHDGFVGMPGVRLLRGVATTTGGTLVVGLLGHLFSSETVHGASPAERVTNVARREHEPAATAAACPLHPHERPRQLRCQGSDEIPMDTRTRKPNRSDGAQGSGGDRKAVTGLLQVCASAPIERARLILRQAERILEARRKAAGEPKGPRPQETGRERPANDADTTGVAGVDRRRHGVVPGGVGPAGDLTRPEDRATSLSRGTGDNRSATKSMGGEQMGERNLVERVHGIEGLSLLGDAASPEAAERILENLRGEVHARWRHWRPFSRQDFGFEYDINSRGANAAAPIPPEIRALFPALRAAGWRGDDPTQVIVTRYPRGGSLGTHIDSPVFGPRDRRHQPRRRVADPLQPRTQRAPGEHPAAGALGLRHARERAAGLVPPRAAVLRRRAHLAHLQDDGARERREQPAAARERREVPRRPDAAAASEAARRTGPACAGRNRLQADRARGAARARRNFGVPPSITTGRTGGRTERARKTPSAISFWYSNGVYVTIRIALATVLSVTPVHTAIRVSGYPSARSSTACRGIAWYRGGSATSSKAPAASSILGPVGLLLAWRRHGCLHPARAGYSEGLRPSRFPEAVALRAFRGSPTAPQLARSAANRIVTCDL